MTGEPDWADKIAKGLRFREENFFNEILESYYPEDIAAALRKARLQGRTEGLREAANMADEARLKCQRLGLHEDAETALMSAFLTCLARAAELEKSATSPQPNGAARDTPA